MAQKKTFQYKKRLAAIFASFAILTVGTLSLLQSMAIDYYSVVNTLEKALPASCILGLIGWVMGAVLDQPRRRPKSGYTNMLVRELMNKEIGESEEEGSEEEESAVGEA